MKGGTQAVLVENSVYKVNQSRSFIHSKLIHPGTRTQTHFIPTSMTHHTHSLENRLPLNDFCLSGCVISLLGSLVWVLRIQQMEQKNPLSVRNLLIHTFWGCKKRRKKKTKNTEVGTHTLKKEISRILTNTLCSQSFWHLITWVVYLHRWGFVNKCVPLSGFYSSPLLPWADC